MKLPSTLAGAAVLFCCSLTQAHTPYLVPGSFDVARDRVVTLDASFTEVFFVPDVAFDNSQFKVIGPDGVESTPERVTPLRKRVVVEHQLPEKKGTYRFSTGHRLGAITRTWEINGERKSSRNPNEPLPPGARLISHFQSITLAETFITVDEPSMTALKPYGKGLELIPITHPNRLESGSPFEFLVHYDGKPLPNQQVVITEGVWASGHEAESHTVTTDATGKAQFVPQKGGTWIALTRHRDKAPPGAAAPEYSHSYTLTFQVAAATRVTDRQRMIGGHGEDVAAFIQQHDANADGKVSQDEFTQFRRKRYAETDASGDGSVDFNEYAREFDGRFEHAIAAALASELKQTQNRFAALDKDKDGFISRAEYDASGQRMFKSYQEKLAAAEKPRARRRDVLNMPTSHTREGMVALYDTNGDGKIARKEFDRRRDETFKRTDENGDGKLSFDEYRAEFQGRLDQQVAKVREASTKATHTRFGTIDKDKNGRLSWEEYAASGTWLFQRADRDKNGMVEAADADHST